VASSLTGVIGHTPLVEVRSLSALSGCRILAKLEQLNPGGSVKDRAALWMVLQAERTGALQPGDTIVEVGVLGAVRALSLTHTHTHTHTHTLSQLSLSALSLFSPSFWVCKSPISTHSPPSLSALLLRYRR
jgi:Pyridoxal-phosphate dependent enzyme